MTTERIDPPFEANERDMLNNWLEFHRATLEMKCEGLSAEQLRERAVPPSIITLLGLVRHMAEVERSWFRRTLKGEAAGPIYYTDEDPDGDFNDVGNQDPEEALAAWRAECDVARANVAAEESLDVVGKGVRDGQGVTLRWMLVHMIEEYARHNGHADFLRERIDGVTGD
jgi:uncharacterized damage-inducible protein DinB